MESGDANTPERLKRPFLHSVIKLAILKLRLDLAAQTVHPSPPFLQKKINKVIAPHFAGPNAHRYLSVIPPETAAANRDFLLDHPFAAGLKSHPQLPALLKAYGWEK